MLIFSERNSQNIFIPRWTQIEHIDRYWFANQFLKNKIVVDCACGTGIGTQIYSQSGVNKIYAFDISEDAILEAKKNNNSIEIIQANAINLPLKESSIDVYISFETIEHIDNDIDYLKEAERVLKPGGIFICSTPNRLITNPGCTLNEKPINPYHIREYSDTEFIQLLSKTFATIDLYGQNLKPLVVIKTLNFLKEFVPHPIPARVHQLFKVILYYTGMSHKKGIQKVIENSNNYEFLIAVCRKNKNGISY